MKKNIETPIERLQAGHDAAAKPKYSPACQALLDDAHQRMLAVLNAVDTKKKAIDADPDLSAEGKKKAKIKFAQEGKEAINKIRSELLPGLADHRKTLLKQLDDRRIAPDNIFLQLRQREIRDLLRPLSAKDRFECYQRAIETDDFEVIQAIETAPRAFPLLDAEIIEEKRLERFARKNPADAELADNLGRLHQQIDMLAGLQMRRCETGAGVE